MKRLIYLILLCSIYINPAYARWATYEDASIKFSRFQEVKVDKDGSVETLMTLEAEILKEQGRGFFAHYILTYNGGNDKMKVMEAKTIYKGKEYKVDSKSMEDKPYASSAHGFDQIRQILLAFPKAEIGAKIYLKYKSEQIRPELKGFYGNLFAFGNDRFMEKDHVKLHSQLPLHILINDPEKVLKITKDKSDNFHNLELVLTKPMYKSVISEPSHNVLNSKHITYVSLSSLKEWDPLAKRISIEGYAKVFKEALPKSFIEIADLAEKKTDENDQINVVTSTLNERVQYMGDWRSVEGRLFPRTLEQISKSQLGDCKDFSASTAAILTKMGYNAQVALVRRGIGNFYPKSLPGMGAFNHAIVKVTDKHGKVRWIDPTNFVSMANGVFPDIAGKMSLVLDSKQPSYERIPTVSYEHAQAIKNREISILSNGRVIERGQELDKNEVAISLTGVELNNSKETIIDALFRAFSGTALEEKDKLNMVLPDLKSRIVKDITIRYSYGQDNSLLKTNLGTALSRSYGHLDAFFNTPEYYVSDIFVDSYPVSTKETVVIKGIKANNVQFLDKEIKTPWLYVKRKCDVKGDDLQIVTTTIIYQNLIPNEDIRKLGFLELKKELEKNFKKIAIVFDK